MREQLHLHRVRPWSDALLASIVLAGLSGCGTKARTPEDTQSATAPTVKTQSVASPRKCRAAVVPALPRGATSRRIAPGVRVQLRIATLDVDVDVRIAKGRTSPFVRTPGLRDKDGAIDRLVPGKGMKFVIATLRLRNRSSTAIKPNRLVVPFIAIRRAGERQLFGRVRNCPAAAYEAVSRDRQPSQVPIAAGEEAVTVAVWIVPRDLDRIEAYVIPKRLAVPLT